MEETKSPAKKSSSGMKIVIVLVVLLVLCIICSIVGYVGFTLLANRASTAATDLAQKAAETAINNQSNEQGDGNTTFNIGGDGKLPTGFPTDVPVYSGKIIATSSKDGEYTLTMNVTDKSTADLVSYYKSEAGKAGWKLEQEVNIFGTTMEFSKDKRTLTVSILSADDSGSLNTIVVK